MNIQTHIKLQKKIVIILKQKFTNLSVIEAINLANEILDLIRGNLKDDE